MKTTEEFIESFTKVLDVKENEVTNEKELQRIKTYFTLRHPGLSIKDAIQQELSPKVKTSVDNVAIAT